MSFKHLQGWRLNHFPGQPVPMLDNPFSEEKFPNIQSKPPLAQLEAISSCPITCYLGEETDPHLSTTSFQVAVESNKVSPQPPLLQAKQPQLPQPLLIRLVLQTLHQLRCPSLDTLQHLHVSLVVRGPKLNTVFEVRPHQCRVQGHDHCPSPAGHAISDTSQDAIGFLGHLGTLLAHLQPAVHQQPQVLFCLAAFQPLFLKPVVLHGVVVTQVQDLALGLVKPHTIDLGPSIQPVQVPLQSLPTLKQINTPAQLGVICKLTEDIAGNQLCFSSHTAAEPSAAWTSLSALCHLHELTLEREDSAVQKGGTLQCSNDLLPLSSTGPILSIHPSRPPNQDEEADEACYKQLAKVSQSLALVLVGDFNLLDVFWKYNTAEKKQSRRFLECVEDNFLTQLVSEPTRGGALLDLLFTNREGLVGDVVVGGRLGLSDHDVIRVLDSWRSKEGVRKTTTVDFWREDFDLFRSLVDRVPWEAVLRGKGVQEGWAFFKKEIIKVQEQAVPVC
ncbi:hypothetical protein QYF61_009935, partial [Mycteria americana]